MTFDAGILNVSFGGEFGIDKSLAFLSVKPGQFKRHMPTQARRAEKARQHGLSKRVQNASVLASSVAEGETVIRTPSIRVFERNETVITEFYRKCIMKPTATEDN